MAIAIGTVTDSAIATTQVATQTTSITVASGSNRVLAYCLVTGSNHNGSTGASGVVFNSSENFTNPTGVQYIPAFGYIIQWWILVNPTVTTANAVVTYTDGSSASLFQSGTFVQLTGVDQSSPTDAVAVNSGSGTTASVVITTVAANAWILDCVITEDTPTVGAGQTSRSNRATSSAYSAVSSVDGKVTPGAETMDWTLASNDWLSAAISFKPASASTYSHPLSGKLNNLLTGRLR